LDEWGIDSECIAVDSNGDFWIGEEYGPTIWRVNGKTGEVIKRYTPFFASAHEVTIDSIMARRRPNRGFEGIACTPNGKVYAMLQAPINYPDNAAGESSRLHRILEIDPMTDATRVFVYEHEAPTASLKNKEWSIGDMAAINDHEFLVLEHATKEGENVKKIFKIDMAQATPVTREDFNGKTLEQLENAENCVANGTVMALNVKFKGNIVRTRKVERCKPPCRNGQQGEKRKVSARLVLRSSVRVGANRSRFFFSSRRRLDKPSPSCGRSVASRHIRASRRFAHFARRDCNRW
jgi:hypothetical protein